jgi:transposase
MNNEMVTMLEDMMINKENASVARKAEALLLRHEGWTCTDIAEELDVHPDTVSRWTREMALLIKKKVLLLAQ